MFEMYSVGLSSELVPALFPKGPCTLIVDSLAPKYLYRDYFKAKVYPIWVHGPVGFREALTKIP